MKPIMEKYIIVSCLIVVSALFLVSCSPKLESTPTSIPTIQAIKTEKPVPTNTELPTSTLTPTQTFTPVPSTTPTRTPAPDPLEVIKVMQYNVLIGGAVTPWCKQIRLEYDGWEGESTFEDAIEIIRAADPDILIVNEACDWKIPHISDYIVNKLDMNEFFIGEDFIGGVAPVALFSKYEIIESDSLRYSEQITEETIFRGIKAKVLTSKGNELIIIGVHLNPSPGKDDYSEYKKEQAKWLAELIMPIQDENIILAGDMNDTYFVLNPILGEVGLSGLGSKGINQRWESEPHASIDLIYISPSLKFSGWSQDIEFYEALEANQILWSSISDHNPEAAIIGVYPP